jgi:hypothetical protein
MKKTIEKPTAEAKALSLFLMAFKSEKAVYKNNSKRINKLWELVKIEELSMEDYTKEVHNLVKSYGGYQEVILKTVQYYIEKTGEWKSQGTDKYGEDTQKIADSILKK